LLRIATDIAGLERVAEPGILIREYPAERYPSPWGRRWRLLLAAVRSDHLVLHFSLPDIIFFAVAFTVFPFQRCRITTLDFFAGPLYGARLHLIRWSLRRVNRFLVYFKDTSIFESIFALPASKFAYIPFKINSIDLIRKARTVSGGYVFCGGRSRRDFATLFAAVEPLGIPVKIVTSTEQEMNPHGSSLAGLRVPANVEIFTNDASPDFFVNTMAASRLVVIPIVKDSTTQAGIGVYLQAMALGKCVIVSTSLGVSDVLTDGQAIIVPAGDVDALRAALDRAWNYPEYREQFAQAGHRYALPLGGEDELRRSILAALPDPERQ
jgi:glycosyltransferase involved in cell wall biosynthesis